METLGQKQRRFSLMVAKLIEYIYEQGYEVSFSEAYRTDEQCEINAMGFVSRKKLADWIENFFPELARRIRNNGKHGGIENSLHPLRLAIDLNLFLNGRYLTNFEDHRRFGEWWEKQSPDARWGGRWGDGNHYSLEYNGVK